MQTHKIGSLVKKRVAAGTAMTDTTALAEYGEHLRPGSVGIVVANKEITYYAMKGENTHMVYQVFWSATQKIKTHFSHELEDV